MSVFSCLNRVRIHSLASSTGTYPSPLTPSISSKPTSVLWLVRLKKSLVLTGEAHGYGFLPLRSAGQPSWELDLWEEYQQFWPLTPLAHFKNLIRPVSRDSEDLMTDLGEPIHAFQCCCGTHLLKSCRGWNLAACENLCRGDFYYKELLHVSFPLQYCVQNFIGERKGVPSSSHTIL